MLSRFISTILPYTARYRPGSVRGLLQSAIRIARTQWKFHQKNNRLIGLKRYNRNHAYPKLVKAATDLIYELDWNSGRLEWDGDLTGILGYPETDKNVDYNWWLDKIHPEDLGRVLHDMSNGVKNGSAKWKLVYRFRTRDGSYKYIMNHKHVDRDQNGVPEKIIGALTDISDLKEAGIKQQHRISRIRHANNMAKLGYWEINTEDGTVFWSDEMYRILNIEYQSVNPSVEFIWERIDPDDRERFADFIQKLASGHKTGKVEHKIDLPGSEKRYLTHQGDLLYEYGKPQKAIITTQDVTDRRRELEAVRNSLIEKEVLLAETHHRMKNNLAVISGFLERNLSQIDDDRTADLIRSSQSRIQSIAKIHKMLYRSDSLSHISLREYIEELISTIESIFQSEHFEPLFVTDIDDIYLNMNQAIPCGLIVNELVSNSLKHGFNGRKIGTVKVSLVNHRDKVMLSVEDDGSGISEDVDVQDTQTMGLSLVYVLSKQLGSVVCIGNTKKGFCCSIRFDQKDEMGSGGTFTQ